MHQRRDLVGEALLGRVDVAGEDSVDLAERQRHGVGEQAAVEVRHDARCGKVLGVHLLEQLAQARFDLAVPCALVEQRREVVRGQKADVLGEHRGDALQREPDDVALATRVRSSHAAIQTRDEVGDLAGDLLHIHDAWRGAWNPLAREERKRFAVFGEVVDRRHKPWRFAVASQVV